MDIVNLVNGEKLWTGKYWGMVGTIKTIEPLVGGDIEVETEGYVMRVRGDKIVWSGDFKKSPSAEHQTAIGASLDKKC